MKVVLLTTSFPRFEKDDTSVFLEYFLNSLNSAGIDVEVVVPHDTSVPSSKREVSPYPVSRFDYGIFQTGTLAYGAGLLVNLKTYPLRIFQLPVLCLKMLQTGYSASANAKQAFCVVAYVRFEFRLEAS